MNTSFAGQQLPEKTHMTLNQTRPPQLAARGFKVFTVYHTVIKQQTQTHHFIWW